jgi:hypothetical protein
MRPLLPFGLVAVACWVALEFGNATSTVIHHGSYAVFVLAVSLPALATTYLPRQAARIIGAALVWFGLLWLPGLGFHPAQPGLVVTADWGMIGLASVPLAVAGLLLLRSRSISCATRPWSKALSPGAVSR